MTIQKKILLITLGLFGFLTYQTGYCAVTTATITQGSNTLEIDIKYPQGFDSATINTTLSDFVTTQQKEIEKIDEDDKGPANLPGKNSLTISYQIMFQQPEVLSLVMTVVTNQRGAAHPDNHVKTFNFISGKQVSLDEILINQDSLNTIADWSKTAISQKNISDPDWVVKGTKPSSDNYKNWYFAKEGIAIVFDTYQVAAYVYGAQTILLPRSMINPLIRPEIMQLVWGNS